MKIYVSERVLGHLERGERWYTAPFIADMVAELRHNRRPGGHWMPRYEIHADHRHAFELAKTIFTIAETLNYEERYPMRKAGDRIARGLVRKPRVTAG